LEGVGCSPGAQQQTPQYGPCGLDVLRPRMLKAVAAIPPAEIEQTIRDVRARRPRAAAPALACSPVVRTLLCTVLNAGWRGEQQVGNIEVKCEFCQTLVQFSREDLAQLLV
jgi:hypothetical protein